MNIVSLISRKITEFATVDLRSLALFRVCLAVLLLCDLYVRSQDLSVFYTEEGIAPRAFFLENFANSWHFSFHLLGGELFYQIILFAINAFFLMLLLFGFKTRFVTIVCWLFFVSLNNRNYEILTGADVLIRMTLFWTIFLPTGNYFSIDRALSNNKDEISVKYNSPAVIAYILQLVVLYVFTAILKTGAEWRVDYTAVYFALKLEEFATPFAYIMLRYPDLLKFLTKYTLMLELYGTILFFSPIRTSVVRTLAAFAFIVLQLGFGSCLSIGIFPFAGMIVMIPLITSWFWDDVLFKCISFSKTSLTLYYDGCCEFCKKLTYILKEFLILKNTKIFPAQDNADVKQIMEENNSWVVSNNEINKLKFEGIIEVFKASPVFFLIGYLFMLSPIKKLGTYLYDVVANNRQFFSISTKCLEFRDLRKDHNIFFEGLIPTVLITVVIMWNVSGLKIGYSFPQTLKPLVLVLRLDQSWNMFAAYPRKDNGWFVIEANLRDGSKVDLFRGGVELSWEKPVYIAEIYKNNRWRKFMTNYRKKDKDKHRSQLGKYFCRDWNSSHKENGKKLETFNVYFNAQISLPDYKESPVEKKLLWRHYCFQKPSDW